MNKLRVESVSIQAFRCFTYEQTIPLDGKSSFIIGRNSWGKSSLVEAIMWCLFGGEGTPKERDIRNDFYQNGQAEVIVKLALVRENEKWQVVRRLRPGQTESDKFVIDNNNNKIEITKAFPNLTRLAHGTGAHIIFNYQGDERPNVRDLSNFEKIISEYLGAREYDLIGETISSILNNVHTNSKSPYNVRKRFDTLLKISEKIQALYKNTLNEVNSLTTTVPWGTEVVLGYQETNQRINDFISDLKELNININNKIEASNTQELHNRLSIIEKALESELRGQIKPIQELINSKKLILNKFSDIKAKSSSIMTRLDELNKLIDENNRKIADCEEKIVNLNFEINQLEDEKHEKESELALLRGKLKQVDRLIKLLDESEQHSNLTTWNECPICDSHFENEQLKTILRDKKNRLSNQQNKKLNRKIQDLNSQIGVLLNIINNKVHERKGNTICVNNNRVDLAKNKQELDKSNHELEEYKKEISKSTTQEISKDNLIQIIENLINKITREILELEKHRNKHDALYKMQKLKLDNLYSEVHFIELLDKLNTLLSIESSQNWQRKDAALIKYIIFLETINNILNSIKVTKQSYIEELLPEINIVVDTIYQILTEQPSYEHAEIIKENSSSKGVQTDLRFIVSSENPPRKKDPESVLNEQALNALNILPYFVFSKLGAVDHEIDLIVLDDPSRSYDSGRFEKLMSLLSDVENGSQIIITTPDDKKDVFLKLKEKYFKDRVKIIELIDFNKEKGPEYRIMS